MVSMRDALKAAFKSSEDEQQSQIAEIKDSIPTKTERPSKSSAIPTLSESEFNRLRRMGLVRMSSETNRQSPQSRKPDMSRSTTIPFSPVFVSPLKPKVPPAPAVKLVLAPNSRFRFASLAEKSNALLPRVEACGAAVQCRSVKIQDTREVAFGLDFGTSSVKVVIGDMALDKAFAVPFCVAEGIDAYLLPTRLFQTNGLFSLTGGEVIHRDLKLSFVAEPNNPEHQIRIVAFLALVIARARGWLFTKQIAAYKHTEIVWKISVGLPAASSFETTVASQLQKLVSLAWSFAATPHNITDDLIRNVLEGGVDVNLVDVVVVPEIAAQIYGFVVSNSFDKRAANNYLMVDVGAGTVDSSLFHVKPGKGGKWDFEFFTTAVEPHGVTNLHRHRVNWWSDALAKSSAPEALETEMASSKFATDHQVPLPDSYDSYFDNVNVTLENGAKCPDKEFFDNRVVTQVRGKTLWRAWKNNLLDQRSLEGIPFFLCGGGARMKYYLALEGELEQQSGFSWLKAEAWTMGVPGDLIADGLAEADYDRISVAYGLSRLEVGKVIKAIPLPKVAIEPVDTWRDNYIDKDQC
jgi:hypothetical protein